MLRGATDLNEREISLQENISALGQLRLQSEALRRGTYSSLTSDVDTIAWSMSTDSDEAIIAMNRGMTEVDFDLDLDWFANDSLNEIHMDSEHRFSLGAHSVGVFLKDDSFP